MCKLAFYLPNSQSVAKEIKTKKKTQKTRPRVEQVFKEGAFIESDFSPETHIL